MTKAMLSFLSVVAEVFAELEQPVASSATAATAPRAANARTERFICVSLVVFGEKCENGLANLDIIKAVAKTE
jgi:propanediol dehydratase large subunit